MRKIWKRVISGLLVAVLFTSSLDITVQASYVENAETEVKEGSEAEILAEVIEERTEDSKTFRMNDGTFLVAKYPSPIHYKDANGVWKKVDHSLTEETAGQADPDGSYVTTEKSGQDLKIRFSKKLKEGKTVSVGHTDYPISWGIADAEKSTAQIEEVESGAVSEQKGNDRYLYQDLERQKIRYEEIFEGVDAEYLADGRGIKENLILKQRGSQASFEILYDIGKLEAVQSDEQTICLMDGEELVYQIQAPCMLDADGAVSSEVTLKIIEQKKKKLRIQLEASEEWLQEEERRYPVTIDPYVLTETTREDIDTTFISSDRPNENHSDKLILLLGKESSAYGNCRALIRVDLPELATGDMVVNAQLSLIEYRQEFYANSTPDLQVNAYQVTTDWNMSTVTWNSRPGYHDKVLDYDFMRRGEGQVQKLFDITEAAKNWYDGTSENYGIMLKSYNESGSYAQTGVKGYFWPERYNEISDAYPMIQIIYRNNKGLEDYWSYTAAGTATAGTSYVNDYTGNLVHVHDDVSTTGNLLPVSLQHVYNSGMMTTDYMNNYPKTGRGWKLSIQQTVKRSSAYGLSGQELTDYPYAYEDGDGTVHFFRRVEEDGTTKYLDEDGLNLELTISGNVKTITDKKDNRMTFDNNGNLNEIRDASGNKITVTYAAGYGNVPTINKITDGAGHTIIVTTNSAGYLTGLTDPEGKTTSFSYNGSMLYKIIYPNGTASRFTYDSERALIQAKSSDMSGHNLTYTSLASGKRVETVSEFGSDGTMGQKLSFDRTDYNITRLQTSGKDDQYGTADDLMTHLQFDNYGRTVGTYYSTSEVSYYGGGLYSYTDGKADDRGRNIRSLNKISRTAQSSRNSRNYLKNHSAESDGDWSSCNWSGNVTGGSAAYTTEESRFGNRAFRIISGAVAGDGGYSYAQDLATTVLIPKRTYTYSSYVKTEDVRNSSNTDGYGACLAVEFTLTDGTCQRLYSDYVRGTSYETVEEGWQRVSLTFTVPESATGIRAHLLIRNASGTAYFDGVQIEKGDAVHAYNLLENSSFEERTGTLPEHWNGEATTSDDRTSTAYLISGNYSMKIVGAASLGKGYYQNVQVKEKEESIYIASFWGVADAVPLEEDTRKFGIYAKIFYADGTTKVKEEGAQFNCDVSDWQKASLVFDLSDGDGVSGEEVVQIQIGVRYSGQANVAYFDDAQLVKDVADSYTYDADGNLITTKEKGDQTSSYTYNADSDLTSVRDAKDNLYQYTYNDAHQVTQAVSPMGQKIQFTYNEKGLSTAAAISNGEENKKILSGSTYTGAEDGIAEGAYLQTETSAHGDVTVYDHEVQSGRLESVTTPDNVTTFYTYDTESGALTGVSAGGAGVSYSYDSNDLYLTKITRGSLTYQFQYDVFGNLLSAQAGGRTLSTNTYGANNGKLLSTAYGNGTTKSYTYDGAGNLTREKVGGQTAYTWSYDTDQNLTSYLEAGTGREHLYEYDMTGRLLAEQIRNALADTSQNDPTLFVSRYGYDERNQLKTEYIEADEKTVITDYQYNENGQPSGVSFDGVPRISYGYDGLGRLTTREVAAAEDIKAAYSYESSRRNGEGETVYTTALIQEERIGERGYRYEYDLMGNLTVIKEGVYTAAQPQELSSVETKCRYVYDSLNQLVREDNKYLGKTITYSYDKEGNIQSKNIYEYTEAEDLKGIAATDTISYGYDSQWKDLLVNYDGEQFTYDEIGNPETYRGKSLRWEGRSLKKIEEGNLEIDYTYGADGLRTTKTIHGGESSEYYYSNGCLVYEKRGTKELYYSYDSLGMLSRIQYNNAVYYPMTNSRGDVEAIYDAEGDLVVRYYYDSWGKIIEVQEVKSTGDDIGNVNPIRYRGYYYDAESGFYYVSSRYYDPEVGRFLNADSVISGTGESVQGYNLFSYCFNNPVNMSDSDGNWPKWVKKVAKAVAVATVVTIAVGLTAGVAAMALGASATVAAGVFTGALAGGAVASTVNIGMQIKKKGANKVSSKEVAKSAFYGASTGAVSGGVSMGSTAAKSAAQILVHKGIQAGANMTISTSAYIMQTSISGNEMSLYGTGVSALGGLVSGVTFNAPMGQALGISLGLELAGNGEELINIFGEKRKNNR